MRKNIFTRAACALTAALMMAGSVLMLPKIQLKASAESEGYWELYEMEAGESSEWEDGKSPNAMGIGMGDYCYHMTLDVGVGKAVYTKKCVQDHYSASGYIIWKSGDTATVTAETATPPEYIKGGETVTVKATLSGTYVKRQNAYEDPLDISEGTSMDICAIYNKDGNNYKWFEYGDGEDGLYTSWDDPTISADFKCEIKTGSEEGQILEIRPRTLGTQWFYRYKWHSGEAPEGGDKDDEEEGGYWKQVDKGHSEETTVKGSRNFNEQFSEAEWSGDGTTFRFSNKKINMTRESWFPEGHSCAGENVEQTLTISSPKEQYLAGETISLKVESTVANNSQHDPLQPVEMVAYLCYHEVLGSYNDNIRLLDDRGNRAYGVTSIENGAYSYTTEGKVNYNQWGYEGQSTTAEAQFPEGTKEGEELWLVEDWDWGVITYWYKYVWVKGSPDGATGKDKDKDKEDDKYYWRYDGTHSTYGEAPAGSLFEDGAYVYDNGLRSYKWSWKPVKGGCRFRFDYLKNETNDYDGEFHDKGGCKGEYAIFTVTGSDINKSYLPGEAVNMRLKIDAEKSKYLCRVVETTAWGFAYITRINPDTDPPIWDQYTDFDDGHNEAQLGYGFKFTDDPNESVFMDISAKMPEEAEEGDVVYVVLHCQAEDVFYKAGLRYVYTKGTPFVGGTVGFKGSDVQMFETVEREAWETRGEDDGRDIPLEIFGGAVGAIGCVGCAVAAAGKGKKGKQKGSQKNSSFRMIIYKEFGDALKKGAAPLPVYARIAEYGPDGVEIPRYADDLTYSISLYSDTPGLEVTPIGKVGDYMAANVRIPDPNSPITDAVVCARFSSFGGVFTEKVHFRAAGKPYLEFTTETVPVKKLTSLVALMSDQKTYELDLNACDFAETPTALVIDKHCDAEDGEGMVDVTFDKTGTFTYKVHIANLSPIGYWRREPKLIYLRFTASNANEQAVTVFRFYICPEGISVIKPQLDKFGRLVINTEDADPGENVRIEPTVVKFICTYTDASGENVIADDNFALRPLEPTDDRTRHVLCEFEYETNMVQGDNGCYSLMPKKVLLVDRADPLLVSLPVEYLAGSPKYTLDLPVMLDGEPLPDQNILDREREWELLKRACQRYGLTNNGKAQDMMRAARGTEAPASILRQIRYAICYEAKLYYEKEAEQMTKLGDKMDRIVTILSVAKWFGEQCRTYLLKRYTGDLGELLLNPLIDLIFVDIGGEYFFRGGENYNLQENLLKKVEQIAENKFSSLMTDPFTGDSFSNLDIKAKAKKASGWIVCFYATVAIKYYYLGDETKGDIGRSCLLALKDLGSTALKTAISKALGDWLNKQQSGPKSFAITRRNTETNQLETVQSSYVDMMLTNTFRWFKKTTGKYEYLKKFFDKCIVNQKSFFGERLVNFNSTLMGGSIADALADVFANSTVDSVIALFTGDRFVLKMGDAELHFDLVESLQLVLEYFMTFFGIDYFLRLLGRDQAKLPQVPGAIPYATVEETQELENKLKNVK